MKNKLSMVLVAFFFCQVFGVGQTNSSKNEVEKLKKTEPELWYVDLKPPTDTTKKDTVNKKSETYIGRESIFEPQNLENIFAFFQYLFFAILAAAILYLVVKSKFSFGSFKPSNEKVNEEITENTKN